MIVKGSGSGKPMTTIKESDAIICPYGNDRCAEPSCCHNEFFVPSKSGIGVFGIPLIKCPSYRILIEAMIMDESIDIPTRKWMKDCLLEGKHRQPPPEMIERINGKSSEMIEPSASGSGVKDV